MAWRWFISGNGLLDLRCCIVRQFPKLRYKTVALAGNRYDVTMLLGPFSEHLPDRENLVGEIGLENRRPGPTRAQEFVPADDSAGILDKVKKNLKGLRGEQTCSP